MDGFWRALSFLTIVPLRSTDLWTPAMLGSSMAYYPLVGGCIGLLLWSLYMLLRMILPATLTMVLLLGVLAVLTGGLHLDGLADTIDGLSRGRSREDTLQIFKDPHIGARAVVGLTLLLLLKYACLQGLPCPALFPTLLLMPTISRYSMVQLAFFSSYARASGGLGAPFVSGIRAVHWRAAVLGAVGLAVLAGGVRGGLIWLLISLVTLGYQHYCRWRLHGITGDILGAINEVNEVLVLLLASRLYA
jgi:adenosylcobinamide-GDP ribazoletransferase